MLADINNNINKLSEPILRKPLTSLDVGKAYVIKHISCINTRFGKSIVVELLDGSESHTTYLPKRTVDIFNEDVLKEINKSDGKYTLTYLGQSDALYAGGCKRSLLKFDFLP